MGKSLIPEPWRFAAPGGLRLVDVRSTRDLAEHEAAWTQLLLQSSAASPMLAYPQISAFLETQVPQSETWLCLFAYDADRLVGVMPLIAARSRRALGVGIIFFKMPYDIMHTGGVDCLTLDGREDLLEVFVSYLSAIPRTWPLIRFRDLPEHSATVRYLRRDGARLRAWWQRSAKANYIPVPSDYDEYHAGLSSNFKRQLKRGNRKLQELPEVRFTFRETTRTAADNLRRFEENEHSGWKGEKGTSITAAGHSSDFYRIAAERFGRQGLMEWNFLETGDRTIASQFGIRINRTLFLLKIAYDQEFAACSPGNLLLARTVARASELADLDEIDCVADCDWHRNWAMHSRPVHDLVLLPHVRALSAALAAALNSNAFRRLQTRLRERTPATKADPTPE